MSQPNHKGDGTNTNQTRDDKENLPEDVDFDPSESAVFTWDEDDPQNPEAGEPDASAIQPAEAAPVSRFGEISSFLNHEFKPGSEPSTSDVDEPVSTETLTTPNLIDIISTDDESKFTAPETPTEDNEIPADVETSHVDPFADPDPVVDEQAPASGIPEPGPILDATDPARAIDPIISPAALVESGREPASIEAPLADSAPTADLENLDQSKTASTETSAEDPAFHLVVDKKHEEEEPFFPIPKHIPEVPPEDTEDITGQRERARGGILTLLFNLFLVGGLLFIFATAAVALIFYKHATHRLYDAQDVSSREFVLTVNPGDRFGIIVERLRSEHVINSYMGINDKYLMRYLAWSNENSHLIKAGAYKLNANMSLSDIYARLIKGSQDFRLTIPEGKTVSEVASLVRSKNDFFDAERFIQLANDPSFIQRAGFQVPSLEGYLYPSTYFFGPGMKEEDLIKTMLQTFKDTVGQKLQNVPHADDLTFHQHVIMASLIEREARIDADRPLIASVMFNRLKKGMPLQIDASVLYALGSWTKPLTYADLKIEHPYNTYKNKGLPPGPICNPRAASILATFQPEQTDFIYYVYKGDGSHAFAKTFEEHKANVRLYLKNRPEAIDTESTQGTVLAASVGAAPNVTAAATTETVEATPTPEPTKASARKTAAPTKASTKKKTPTPKPTVRKTATKAKVTPKPTKSKSTSKPTPKPTPKKVARTSPIDLWSHSTTC